MAEYIVGIDFGHGETAAWVIPINNSAEKNGYPLKLTASNSEPQIRSVVYKSGSGEYSLENNGCTPIPYFKGRIRLLNESQKKAYRAFIQLAFERILRHNQILVRDRETQEYNFELCIACPTSWEDKDVKEYLDFFNDALSTKGIQVKWVIKESDAAFFSKQDMVNRDEVTLVIDYGSSTIDYTVLENMKKISSDDWSNTYGASCIDDLLTRPVDPIAVNRLNATLRNWRDEIERTQNNHLVISDILKLACRICKENYFKENATRKVHVSVALSKYISNLQDASDEMQERTTISYYVELLRTEEFTNYLNRVLEDFEVIRTRLEGMGKGVDNVILSGGACVMPWVADAVGMIFKGATIKDDGLPQFVVAKGVALYAKAQMEALEKLKEKLEREDFAKIYQDADRAAMLSAVDSMSSNSLATLRSQEAVSADSIRSTLCGAMQRMDANDPDYWTLFQNKFNTLIGNAAATCIKDAVKEVFSVEIDTKDVRIYVNPVRMVWGNVAAFTVGGNFYNMIGDWIVKKSGAFFGNAFFKWGDDRKGTEKTNIIDGTLSCMKEYFKKYNLIDANDLKCTAQTVKDKVLDSAIEIFYSKQIFKTTFSD